VERRTSKNAAARFFSALFQAAALLLGTRGSTFFAVKIDHALILLSRPVSNCG
jgi:hypothetical protein